MQARLPPLAYHPVLDASAPIRHLPLPCPHLSAPHPRPNPSFLGAAAFASVPPRPGPLGPLPALRHATPGPFPHLCASCKASCTLPHHSQAPLPSLAYRPALDLSAPLRQYAVLPLALLPAPPASSFTAARGAPRLKVFVPRAAGSNSNDGFDSNLIAGCVQRLPLPHTVAAEGETPEQAACR